jgi:hypothetical protein
MTDLPPLNYDFIAPPRIVFGWGRRQEVGPLAAALGTRALLITGSRTLEQQGTIAKIEMHLQAAGVQAVRLASVTHEPEVQDVDAAVAALAAHSVAPGEISSWRSAAARPSIWARPSRLWRPTAKEIQFATTWKGWAADCRSPHRRCR